VSKWLLAPPATLAPQAALVLLLPEPLASPRLEVEVVPRQRGPRQGTKRGRLQIEVENQVQAQIRGGIKAIQLVELVLGRGKRVRISRKK
jgi:hypothetical protein